MTVGGPLVAALDGRLAEWRWEPGLTPGAVGDALGMALSTAPIRLAGRDRLGSSVSTDAQPQAAWFVWEADGSLALVELAALGPASDVLDYVRGPYPGSEQQVHLHRGVTVFDGFNYGITSAWLFRPTDLTGYLDGFGANETPRRAPR